MFGGKFCVSCGQKYTESHKCSESHERARQREQRIALNAELELSDYRPRTRTKTVRMMQGLQTLETMERING